MLYKGEISLHFDIDVQYCQQTSIDNLRLPTVATMRMDGQTRPSCRTRSPLLWALIRILGTARFIELLYVRSPF